MTAIFYHFASFLFVASVATLMGYCWKRPSGSKIALSSVFFVFIATWMLVFAVAIFAPILLETLGADKENTENFGRTLIPLAIGSYFARRHFRSLEKKPVKALKT